MEKFSQVFLHGFHKKVEVSTTSAKYNCIILSGFFLFFPFYFFLFVGHTTIMKLFRKNMDTHKEISNSFLIYLA